MNIAWQGQRQVRYELATTFGNELVEQFGEDGVDAWRQRTDPSRREPTPASSMAPMT